MLLILVSSTCMYPHSMLILPACFALHPFPEPLFDSWTPNMNFSNDPSKCSLNLFALSSQDSSMSVLVVCVCVWELSWHSATKQFGEWIQRQLCALLWKHLNTHTLSISLSLSVSYKHAHFETFRNLHLAREDSQTANAQTCKFEWTYADSPRQ